MKIAFSFCDASIVSILKSGKYVSDLLKSDRRNRVLENVYETTNENLARS